jgi:hypothetical protein
VTDTTATYLITDPTGVGAPFLYTVDLPESDAEVIVDAYDESQLAADPFDPAMGENPFGTARSPLVSSHAEPLIAGFVVSFSIRSFLTSVAVSAVAAVFKYLVDGACNAVAPLYAERCSTIASIAGTLVELAGGIRTGAGGWDLAETGLDGTLAATGFHCDRIGKSFVGYVADPRDDRALTRFRELARRFNYLLHVMETDPQPGQPSWETVRAMARALIYVRNVVRNDYFELYNRDSLSDRLDVGYGIGLASDAVAAAFGALEAGVPELVLRELEITEVVRWYLRVGPRSSTFVVETMRYSRARFDTFVDLDGVAPTGTGFFFDCAANFVQGAAVQYYDDASASMVSQEITTNEITGGMLDVLEGMVDVLYQRSWGGTIPGGTCLPDEYEPNARWQEAVASPLPTSLVDGSVVELNRLNLCDAVGMSGADEDWYAYYVAPVEFRVQSRIVGLDPPSVGQDQPICVDVYFYSQIYELSGAPPDRITGTCGTVSDWPATESFGVRRTLGEEWSMILLHVRPGEGATGPIDYGIRFIP